LVIEIGRIASSQDESMNLINLNRHNNNSLMIIKMNKKDLESTFPVDLCGVSIGVFVTAAPMQKLRMIACF
jgi:hypothetical protein